MMLQAVDWNDANIAKLKRLWTAGQSASQIAAAIPYASRSAVLGKVSRLKLAPRRDHNARAATQPVERINLGHERRPRAPQVSPPRKDKPSRIASSIFGNFTHAKPDAAPIPDTDPSDGKGITMLELTNRTCRWPKGDPLEPDFLFCGEAGADLEERRPYCSYHSRKAVDRAGTRRSTHRLRDPETIQPNF
jgi:GcrA cell cycle regulator